jgi:hypothetical protein
LTSFFSYVKTSDKDAGSSWRRVQGSQPQQDKAAEGNDVERQGLSTSSLMEQELNFTFDATTHDEEMNSYLSILIIGDK